MPIAKTELFDVDALRNLLKCDAVSKGDKLDLMKYRKRARDYGNNKTMITYDFSDDWKVIQKGRYYPTPHRQSLCSFPSQISAALAQKYYWDLDFVNCHPTLAIQIAAHHSIPTPALEEYCHHREEILKEMMEKTGMTRDEVKTEWIITLFGGMSFSHPLIPKVKLELTSLANVIQKTNPDLYKNAIDVKMKKKKNCNPLYSCLAIYLQDQERKCLLALDTFLASQGRSLDVFKFDGGLLRKQEGEVSLSQLLPACEKAIFAETGYSMELTVKPLTHSYEFQTKSLYPADIVIDDRFACQKFIELNENTFLRDGKDVYMIHPTTGLWSPVSFSDFNEVLGSCTQDMVFLQESLAGIRTFNYAGNLKNIKSMYEFLPICCKKGKVPIEFLGSLETNVESEKEMTLLSTYLELINLVSKHNKEKSEYLLNYLAHALQKPRDLPGVCIVVTGKQGSGKDTLFDIFMNSVIGKTYQANMKNEDFFNPYDTLKVRKVMVKLEEANKELCFKHRDLLKNIITGTFLSVNPKHKEPYEAENFARFIFTTNSENPIHFEGSDRRFVLYDSSEERVGDNEFWTEIRSLFFCQEAGHVLYKYFMQRDISQFDPRIFPISDYQQGIQEESKPILTRFIEEWDGEKASVRDLYKHFVSYCKNKRIKEDEIYNENNFSKKLMIYVRDGILIRTNPQNRPHYNKPENGLLLRDEEEET